MTSSLDRSTHFIVGESTLDELPDQWLIQYYNAFKVNNLMQMSTIKQLTGLSHLEILTLLEDREIASKKDP